MFIDKITLTSDHWSYKLLHYCFPSLPRFYNFCPHFWLTILSLFLVIFIFIGRTVSKYIFSPIGILFKTINKYFFELSSKSSANKAKKFIDSLSEDSIKKYEYYVSRYYQENFTHISKCERALLKRIRKYNNYYYTYYGERHPKLDSIRKNFDPYNTNFDELKFELKYRTPTPQIKETPWYPKAISIAKYSLAIIVIPALYFVGYLVYWTALFIGWLWYWIVWAVNHPKFWPYMGQLGIFLIFALTLIIIILVFIKIFTSLQFKSISLFCVKPIKWLWKKIVNVTSFFIVAILQFKQNNCPEIIWTEKSEKRK